MKCLLIFFALFWSSVAFSEGEIFRWLDADGRVYYGDRPPLDAINPEKVGIKSIEASSASSATVDDNLERQKALLKSIDDNKRKQQESNAVLSEEVAELQALCNELRLQVQDRQRARLVYELNENGERQYLNDEQRSASDEQLRQEADRVCNEARSIAKAN